MVTIALSREREIYRKQVLDRVQRWESNIIHLRAAIRKLEGNARLRCETRLHGLEKGNRNVFGRYADLLLADDITWDERRAALDAAGDELEGLFIDFAMNAQTD